MLIVRGTNVIIDIVVTNTRLTLAVFVYLHTYLKMSSI